MDWVALGRAANLARLPRSRSSVGVDQVCHVGAKPGKLGDGAGLGPDVAVVLHPQPVAIATITTGAADHFHRDRPALRTWLLSIPSRPPEFAKLAER